MAENKGDLGLPGERTIVPYPEAPGDTPQGYGGKKKRKQGSTWSSKVKEEEERKWKERMERVKKGAEEDRRKKAVNGVVKRG